MPKNYKYLLILFFLVISLAGCKDRMEIDRITFPVALGIDWDETSNIIKIYAQVSNLSGQNGGQIETVKTFKVIEGQGETLVRAMTDIIDHSQQYLSWKHVIVIVITNKMAEHGISGELDRLIRFEQIHLNCYLLLTDENLNDLFEAASKIESGLSTPLSALTLISEQNTNSKVVTLRDFVMSYLSKEAAPVMPVVSIYKKEEKQKEILLDFNGIGVFRNDRLIGRLDSNGSSSMQIISGLKYKGSLIITEPGSSKDNAITISGLETKTKTILSMQQNKPSIKLKIQAVYDITQDQDPKILDIQQIDKINILVESNIKKEVKSIIRKAQMDLKADLFGFGGDINRKYPGYWLKNEDNWQEIFPKVNIDVEVTAQLDNTGYIKNSLKYMFGKD